MADFEMTVGDLYPPLPGILSDTNGPVSIAAASSVEMIAASAAHTISGDCTVLETTFTANTTINSATVTNVSAFTNLWLPGAAPWSTGSPIYAPGVVPAPSGSIDAWVMPTIQSWNQGANTLTLTQAALATATGVTFTANIGYCWYVWVSGDTANAGTYTGVMTAAWGSKPQTFPSEIGSRFTLQLDAVP